MPSKELRVRKSSYDTGTASEFLVLSCLYRLGVNAFISLGNKKSIDIIIKATNGYSLSVDVKSVRDYSSIPINNLSVMTNHFIVVVIYRKQFSNPSVLPDFYIIPSKDIPQLRSTFKNEQRLMKGRLVIYKDRWDFLKV